MAQITSDQREQYAKSAKPYQAKMGACAESEKQLILQSKTDAKAAPYKKIELCNLMIEWASLHMACNSLSVQIMNFRNNDVLNDARKLLYKAIIYMEDIVTPVIDMPYGDLIKNYDSIARLSTNDRFTLVTKLGFMIASLEEAFGENSKWKWSFVELRGRFACVVKNFIDMRIAAKAYLDPGNPEYETSTLYIRMLSKLLDNAGTGYRDKYELSTKRIDDMKNAIRFALAKHRLCLTINNVKDAEEAKGKAVVWNNKLKNDQKKGLTK